MNTQILLIYGCYIYVYHWKSSAMISIACAAVEWLGYCRYGVKTQEHVAFIHVMFVCLFGVLRPKRYFFTLL